MKKTVKYDEIKLDRSTTKEQLIVGFCDDEKSAHDTIRDLLNEYADEKSISIKLINYISAEQMLVANDELDFLLLDIDMPKMDGIEAGYRLRSIGKDYKIIMLTARDDRFREAFKIGAFRFVSKPVERKELYDTIDAVIENMSAFQKVVVYRDGVKYKIIQKDILYIEANHSSTMIFTINNEFRSEMPLAEWKDVLDSKAFFQCHKSFMVNLGKIKEIQGNTIIMYGGDKVAISRRLNNDFMKAYMVYDTKWR